MSCGVGKNYWQPKDRRVYANCPTVTIEGRRVAVRYGEDLTPLDELAAPNLHKLPTEFREPLRADFWRRIAAGGWSEKYAAQAALGVSVGLLIDEHLDIAYDFEEIEIRARRYAEICGHIPTIEGAAQFCEAKGIEAPAVTARSTDAGRLKRCRDSRFWRRALSRRYSRRAENAARSANLVRRGGQLYATSLAVRARHVKDCATETWLRERSVIADDGTQLNLFDVRQKSQANPALRRAELMVRLRGFEEIAKEMGHVADFVTLTCPSEYHATEADSGKANPRYAGHSVRDAQAWLQKMWARSRAKFKRKSILVYGFRIAEPHHDGTPHWHMVLFVRASDREALRFVLTSHWLSESGSEPGATNHRIKFKSIDADKGTAAGYLAKYVAKNIDGHEVGEDYEAGTDRTDGVMQAGREPNGQSESAPHADQTRARTDATSTVKRVTAWATLHGIRQFQQIGGPQVTIYRECRRLRNACDVRSIERARVCADAGDWRGFTQSIGGIEAGRKGTLALWCEETGECNQYGECRSPQIVGIRGVLAGIKTRSRIWRIVKSQGLEGTGTQGTSPRGVTQTLTEARTLNRRSGSAQALGPVSITVRSGPGDSEPRGWANPNETSMYGPH